MANDSIFDAFERLWQQALYKLSGYATTETLDAHIANKLNPHEVTKDQVGLSNVDNTADADKSVKYADEAAKVAFALTVGEKNYDGSAPISIAATDFGLSGAMRLIGATTTVIFNGSTTQNILIDNVEVTAEAGNVTLYDGLEFVWGGSSWIQLGDESSFKVKQTPIADPSASGSAVEFIDTISQNENGNITATKKSVAFPVTGVKGDSESSYRTGDINITKENIGLGNVDNTADSTKSVSHAATADSATADANGDEITSTYATKTELSKLAQLRKTYHPSASSSRSLTYEVAIPSEAFGYGYSIAAFLVQGTLYSTGAVQWPYASNAIHCITESQGKTSLLQFEITDGVDTATTYIYATLGSNLLTIEIETDGYICIPDPDFCPVKIIFL